MRIGIIGFGAGGSVAGMKLAKAGFEVDIFEIKSPDKLSHDWYDDIRFDIFENCGIENPPREIYTDKGHRLFISPDEKNSLKVPFSKPLVEISISRRALGKHLTKLAIDAGCKIYFGTKVDKLLVNGDRVTGVKVNGEDKLYDLVIDSSGLYSPFRAQVPSKFGIQAQPGENDVMFAWRGFYKHTPGTEAPDPDRNIYIKHLNSVGLSWCNLNDRDEVDVFVGRIGKTSKDEIENAIGELHKNHDFFSYDVIKEGATGTLPLRGPIASMCADGYVVIGDAAFMTMPMMGSGIEASFKAATWLSDIIIDNKVKDFKAADLWPYQVKYYHELGAKYAFIDIVKRWVLNINVKKLNWLFGCGAVTNEDMGLVSTEKDNPNKLTVGKIIKKVFIILKRPGIIFETAKWMIKGIKGKKTAMKIPEEYNEKRISKWIKKYNNILIKIER